MKILNLKKTEGTKIFIQFSWDWVNYDILFEKNAPIFNQEICEEKYHKNAFDKQKRVKFWRKTKNVFITSFLSKRRQED